MRIASWNLLVLLAGLFFVELVMGNWFRNDPLKYLHINRNGSWQYAVSYPGIHGDERKVIYTRDRWGLRGDYGNPEDIDILTVGGSTTDQRYITDGATWQDVLATHFERDGYHIGIANAGINGRTTFGHQFDFDLWFPSIDGLQPRYVLLYIGVNDMFFDRPNSRFDEAFRANHSFSEQIKRNSALYFLYRTVIGVYLAKKRDLAYVTIDYEHAEWTDVPLLSDHRRLLSERLQGYARRFASLLAKIDEWGAVPIVVTQPRGDYRIIDGRVWGLVNTQPRIEKRRKDNALGVLEAGTANGVDFHSILSLFNEASMRLCKQSDGICVDLANELRFVNGDFYDHAHNTKRGAKKIGDYLYLKLQGLIARRPEFTS